MAIKYTEEQLNNVDKSLVIQMLLAEQERTEELTNQVKELNARLTAMDENSWSRLFCLTEPDLVVHPKKWRIQTRLVSWK